MSRNSNNIGIIGGGFVGITLAAKILKNQDTTLTILENDSKKIVNFIAGSYGVSEPGLDELLSDAYGAGRLKFLKSLGDEKLDAVFICVGTPRTIGKDFDRTQFNKIFSLIRNNLKIDSLVFLRSTVEIGTTRSLNNYVKLSDRKDIKIFFAPERTAEGVALKELDELPQLLGAAEVSDLQSGSELLTSLGFDVITTTSVDAAEFIKLMCNVWRDTVFGISNEFALVAESLNLNVWELIEKANLKYPRAVIPKPGPVNGPCLSKDTYIFIESYKTFSRGESILLNARKINELVETKAFDKIMEHVSRNSKKSKILFLGAAFKGLPETNDTRQGLTSRLINFIVNTKIEVEIEIWDPTLSEELNSKLSPFYTNQASVTDQDIIVFGNNSKHYVEDSILNQLKKLSSKSLIIDMWGIIKNPNNYDAELYTFGNGVQ